MRESQKLPKNRRKSLKKNQKDKGLRLRELLMRKLKLRLKNKLKKNLKKPESLRRS
jgi:hypothetical protein